MQDFNSNYSYFESASGNYAKKSIKFPWSLLRKFEAQAVCNMLVDVNNKEYLEYGCGAGFYTGLLLGLGAAHVTAVDASESMVKNIPVHPNLTKLVSDASKLNICKKFNNIISCGMLEFVDDVDLVLNNFSLHAHNSAELILLIPEKGFFGMLYKLFHKKNGINIKLFGLKEITRHLNQANWVIKESVSAGLFSRVIKAKYNNE